MWKSWIYPKFTHDFLKRESFTSQMDHINVPRQLWTFYIFDVCRSVPRLCKLNCCWQKCGSRTSCVPALVVLSVTSSSYKTYCLPQSHSRRNHMASHLPRCCQGHRNLPAQHNTTQLSTMTESLYSSSQAQQNFHIHQAPFRTSSLRSNTAQRNIFLFSVRFDKVT